MLNFLNRFIGLVALPLIFFFCGSVVLSEATDDFSNLDHDKLIEAAKLGNKDAQFRYAKLIRAGIIKNGTHGDYKSLLEAAAEQGHEFATYDLFDQIDFECRAVTDVAQSYPSCIAHIKALLTKLGNADKAHANLLLFGIWNDEIFIDYKSVKAATAQQKKIPVYYLEKAAELGSREASRILALRLFSTISDTQEPLRALELLEKAVSLPKDYGWDDETYKIQTCLILRELNEYYSGTKEFKRDDINVAYNGAVDPIKRLSTLKLGTISSCRTLMVDFVYYNLSETNPDYFQNYMLVLEALKLYEAEDNFYQSAADELNFMLANLAVHLEDTDLAKNHLAAIKTENWREVIFQSYGTAQLICRSKGIGKEACADFIHD